MPSLLKGLSALNRWIERALSVVLLIILLLFLVLIIYQILSRNLPFLPAAYWTEEFSRFSFQWMVLLGAALGVLHADHFVLDAFPPHTAAARRLKQLRELVLLGIAIVFVIWGYQFGITGLRRTSQVARLPMIYVYMAFCVSGVLMTLFALQRVLAMTLLGVDRMEAELNAQPDDIMRKEVE